MIPIKIQENTNNFDFITIKKNKFYYPLLIIILLLLSAILLLKNNVNDKVIKSYYINERKINTKLFENKNRSNCYISPDNSNLNIVHLIITRFLMTFWRSNGFPQNILSDDYIPNGFRVMKKYLIPSLENQSCKNFTWVLLLGNDANISQIKSLINFNMAFDYKIIYHKNFRHYLKNITKDSNILITTRIDYDDRIYYDAVNDVRKIININKPMLVHGYNRGVYYFELDGNYYEFYKNYNNTGVMSIFLSLIIVLNKLNNIYTIIDFGDHSVIRKTILENYQSYGIIDLNYEPAIFDSGCPKFVWVRQKYSGSYNESSNLQTRLKKVYFNLSKFYGR